jgi:hypothetical protein
MPSEMSQKYGVFTQDALLYTSTVSYSWASLATSQMVYDLAF